MILLLSLPIKTNATNLDLDTLLPAGGLAPMDGVLISQKNYRIFANCVDSADIEEQNYNAKKSKDFWINLGEGVLIGISAALIIKH